MIKYKSWYKLVIDESDGKKELQRFFSYFNSFKWFSICCCCCCHFVSMYCHSFYHYKQTQFFNNFCFFFDFSKHFHYTTLPTLPHSRLVLHGFSNTFTFLSEHKINKYIFQLTFLIFLWSKLWDDRIWMAYFELRSFG